MSPHGKWPASALFARLPMSTQLSEMLPRMLLTAAVRHAESACGCTLHAPNSFARSAPSWCSEGVSNELAQVGAARKDLHKPQYRRLNLAMLASACFMLGTHAVHADIQTPVADILTILQTGLTGNSFNGDALVASEDSPCNGTWSVPKNVIMPGLRSTSYPQ